MAIDPDPYRTLGLARGATRDEVKRAYRRLAKIHHPDAAGEAALPRFLAIQAAYEQLIGSTPGGRPRRGPSAPSRAWEADSDRGGATRRAYGGRARTTPPGTGGTSSGATGTTDRTRAGPATGSPGRSGSQGTTPPGDTRSRGRRSTSGRDERRRQPPNATGSRGGARASDEPPADGGRRRRNKATLGSTSYDDAEGGPFEPDWSGASWYGTTSGTYWTLNPKEYADPRKHGPEYQARARRATWGRGADPEPADAAEDDGTDGRTPPEPEPDPAATAGPSTGPTHTTSSWWESTAGGAAAGEPVMPSAPGRRGRWGASARSARSDVPPPDLGRAVADIGRALTDEHFGGVRGRVARAVVGWLPIAFGLGWLLGEVTGCGRFAATCDGSAEPMVLMIQVAVLGLLLAVPVLASVATMAALSLLGAAIVAALILSATGAAADGDSRRTTLGVVLLVAWLVGLAVAVMRRFRTLPSPGRPVS
jgi:hypothetical protein